MKLRFYDYRDALAIINSTGPEGEIVYPTLHQRYYEFIEALESISDEEIIECLFELRTQQVNEGKAIYKSVAPAINEVIRRHIEDYPDWEAESFLFNEPEYRHVSSNRRGDSDHTEWRLDFASEDALAVEVAFNHGEAIAWNLSKLQISAELNHVEKAINTKIGIYVCATKDMKKIGNFDGAVGSFEKVLRFFKPMRNQLTAPIVVIGLEPLEEYYIDKDTREVVSRLTGNKRLY